MALGPVKRHILTLSVANLLIGLVEFLFNLYLSRVLGAEGLGMLHLVTPVNCLFLSFMTEGLVTTMSKLSAQHYASGQLASLHKRIKISTLFSFCWSLVLVLLLCLTARPIAVYVLGDASLVFPILSTCPLMLLMSISNILKGHFLGLAKIRIPALINITEKLLRFPLFYLLVRFCLNRFAMPSITLVYLCYALGEVHSVFWLLLYYRFSQPQSQETTSRPTLSQKSAWQILSPLLRGAAPICLTQCLLELVNALSSVIVKTRLCSAGYSPPDALALLGEYKGMVFPLVSFPMLLVGSVCALMVPRIGTLWYTNKAAAQRLMRNSLTVSLCIGLVTALVFSLCAEPAGVFFYKEKGLGSMIRLAALCMPLLALTATSTNLLISIGQEGQSFRNTLLQQQFLLIFLLLFVGMPRLNIYGYPLSIALSHLLLLWQNFAALKRHKST